MVQTIQSEAFVLKKKVLLQKDVLLTLLTQEEGKVTVIAKGVRKITSRRAPHIQTGNLIKVEIYKRGEVLYLQNSTLISAFSSIKDDTQKTNFLYTFFFILDRLSPEYQQETEVYLLTKQFLIQLAKSDGFSSADFTSALNSLLSSFGYTKDAKSMDELLRFTQEIINEKIPHIVI